MTGSETSLPAPSLHVGWRIFATRPVSLVLTLVLAVVVGVLSFGLLVLPAVAAYYHAVRRSRREGFFIDLEAVVALAGHFLRGLVRLFLRGWIVGIFGLLLPVALLLLPALALDRQASAAPILAMGSLLLFVPAFFWAGSVLLHGYPALAADATAFASLRHALSAGRGRPLQATAVGFLVLFPVTGALFHLLMVFSYPILVAAAVATTSDEERIELQAPARVSRRPGWAFWCVMLLALLAGAVAGGRYLGGIGVVFWLGLWIALLLLTVTMGATRGAAIFGLAVGFTAVVLGGGSFIARRWGEALLVPWTLGAIIILVLLLSLFVRGGPGSRPG
jgi:hypothetical protein